MMAQCPVQDINTITTLVSNIFTRADIFSQKWISLSIRRLHFLPCTICVIPISRLPEQGHANITQINGMGGDVSVIGEIIGDITVGDVSLPIFQNINILFTNATIPIIVNQNILRHDTLALYRINNRDDTVEFHRALPSGDVSDTAFLISVTNPETAHNSTSAYGVQPVTSQPMAKPQVNIESLERTLFWLR